MLLRASGWRAVLVCPKKHCSVLPWNATALGRDCAMEAEGVANENKLVNHALAEGIRLLHDGVSEVDLAVGFDANRTVTLREIVD